MESGKICLADHFDCDEIRAMKMFCSLIRDKPLEAQLIAGIYFLDKSSKSIDLHANVIVNSAAQLVNRTGELDLSLLKQLTEGILQVSNEISKG